MYPPASVSFLVAMAKYVTRSKLREGELFFFFFLLQFEGAVRLGGEGLAEGA